MTINAYPLQWPTGWKRTEPYSRREAKFTRFDKRLNMAQGVARVLAELDRMGYTRDDIVISTNVELRLDGLPRSDRRDPADPGSAVYWRTRRGEHKVMAIDLYDKVADNLAAVAATLEAMRAIERHGGAAILERAFTGFAALPAPTGRDWWTVLGVSQHATRDEIDTAWKLQRSRHHPDKNPGDAGAAARFAEVNEAYQRATA